MKTKIDRGVFRSTVAFAAIVSLFTIGSLAFAQETATISSPAPEKKASLTNAFEVAVGAGYNQGVGDVGTNIPSLTNSGGPGVSAEVDLGWRIDPNWLVGVYGTGAWLSTGDNAQGASNNWTATAGIQGNYHFLPGESVDPWVGLGAGWRGYWVNRGGGRDSRHGIDFARVQVGVDVPVAQGIAISPFIGGTASVLLTQQLAQDTSFSNINNPNVNFYLNAGVMGRFDLFGGVSSSSKL